MPQPVDAPEKARQLPKITSINDKIRITYRTETLIVFSSKYNDTP